MLFNSRFTTVVSAALVIGSALRHDRRRAKSTLDISHRSSLDGVVAVLSISGDGRIVAADERSILLFGVAVDELLGAPVSLYLSDWSDALAPPVDPVNLWGAVIIDDQWGRRNKDFAVTARHASGQRFRLAGSVEHGTNADARLHRIILHDLMARPKMRSNLAKSHEQLRQLSASLQTIREQERAHLSRELHDDLGQLMASLQMDLTLLKKNLQITDSTKRLIEGMQTTLVEAITSVRRIATNLRPRALDDGGLYFALKGLSDEFSKRYNISCSLYADESELLLDDIASTTIFRIVQEGLTNVARHADAKNVSLVLYRLNGELLVTIRDDGCGISEANLGKPGSLGIVGMRERVWGMNGEIFVRNNKSAGTSIDIVIPVSKHQKN